MVWIRLSMMAVPVLSLLGCGPDAKGAASARNPDGAPTDTLVAGDPTASLNVVERLGPAAGTDRAAFQLLVRTIRDPRPDVADRAAYWLVKSGPRAVPVFRRALADPTPSIRTRASYGLGLLGSAARVAIPELTELLAGESDSVANMADWALSQVGPLDDGGLAVQLRTFRYGTGFERVDAVRNLGRLGEAASVAVPVLVRALGDSDPLVVRTASDALVSIGRSAYPAVEAAVRSGEHGARWAALLVVIRMRKSNL